jgi:hypothetical protein
MPDFSVILQAPEVRSVVQENILERVFHDALFPRMLFRGEATPVAWPENVGDTMVFSGVGLIPVDLRPLTPGNDPDPVTYPLEQWTAQLQQLAGTIDTHMPTSMVAIANLFLRNAHQLGLMAARTLNLQVRNRMYAAALSGWTVADGAQAGVSTLRVKRLNGFTKARNPNTAGASLVKFDTVSASNPLTVTIYDNTGPAEVTRTVTAYTPDTPGDEFGPGTITLAGGNVTVSDRAYVIASDRTFMVRVGGGNKVDDVGNTDLPTLADIRSAVAHFWQMNVPEHPDQRFHCHLDPVSQAKIFQDTEFQRLLTALPDYYMYKQFAIGELLNTVFFRNSDCPTSDTVVGGLTASYDARDPFVGELFNNGNASTGVKIHRMIFSAQGGIMEYHSNLAALLTDAGILGATADPRIVNNGIEVLSDRIQLIIRAPMNRLQDKVSTSWKFIGDWPVRTDAATGDAARYKRFLTIEHGE